MGIRTRSKLTGVATIRQPLGTTGTLGITGGEMLRG